MSEPKPGAAEGQPESYMSIALRLGPELEQAKKRIAELEEVKQALDDLFRACQHDTREMVAGFLGYDVKHMPDAQTSVFRLGTRYEQAQARITELTAENAALKAEVEEARRTSEYWKAERNACLADAEKAEAERDRLRAALERSEARANRFRKALDDLLRLKGFDASKLKEILAALAPGGGRGGEG